MKISLIVLGAVAAVLCRAPLGAAADEASAARQAIASRQFLIGRWNCTYTVGPRGGAYTTTWADALNNHWLKQTYDQPASGGEPGFLAEYFIGYDARHKAWVRFGAMTTGQYFAIRMTDTGNGGWSWKYVSFFKGRGKESPGSDATFTRVSGVKYLVDGPTYPDRGVDVTEHHICAKAP